MSKANVVETDNIIGTAVFNIYDKVTGSSTTLSMDIKSAIQLIRGFMSKTKDGNRYASSSVKAIQTKEIETKDGHTIKMIDEVEFGQKTDPKNYFLKLDKLNLIVDGKKISLDIHRIKLSDTEYVLNSSLGVETTEKILNNVVSFIEEKYKKSKEVLKEITGNDQTKYGDLTPDQQELYKEKIKEVDNNKLKIEFIESNRADKNGEVRTANYIRNVSIITPQAPEQNITNDNVQTQQPQQPSSAEVDADVALEEIKKESHDINI